MAPSVSPDVDAARAAVTAVAEVIRGLTGKPTAEGLADDLTASPAVTIEPAAPWARYPKVGPCLEVAWRVRLVLGRWDAGPALELALATYAGAAAQLRALGWSVDPLEAPVAVEIAGVAQLVTTFRITSR